MNQNYDQYLQFGALARGFSNYQVKKINLNFTKYFPANKDAYILDIGVGNGEMLSVLRDHNYTNYLGVDISKSTIDACKELNLNCELVDNTIDYLNNNPNKFQLITLIHVLEHISYAEAIDFCQALYNSLAPNGKLIIEVPNLSSYNGWMFRYCDFTHVYGYHESNLLTVLQHAKCQNIEIKNVEDIVGYTPLHYLRRILRKFLHIHMKFWRRISGDYHFSLLNSCIQAIVSKPK